MIDRPNTVIRKPYSPTKFLVPPIISVRVKVRVLESGGRNKRFSRRIIGTHNVM